VLGSAPFALESALRALAGVMLDASGVEVTLRVVGVPPASAVVAWEEATAHGQPLASELAPHRIASLSARIPGLWPPGPYALASAAARILDGIASGSRRRYSCFVPVRPGVVVAMPVEIGQEGVRRIVEPALTRQERTVLDNAIELSIDDPQSSRISALVRAARGRSRTRRGAAAGSDGRGAGVTSASAA
jgi:malate/lactate dehydrogenase